MTDLKYEKYILKGKAEKRASEKSPVVTAALEGLEDWAGIQHRINWKYVSQATLMVEEPHTHDYDEFLVFLGSNPADPKDFDAEIEISLGEKGETHTINTATVVCVPKGLVHCPLNFKRVGKPILFSIIYLSPDYVRKPASMESLFPAGTGDSEYGKYVLREPKGEGPRKLDTEEWGVSINEDITSGIGTFNCNFNFLGILGPHVLPDPPHDHNCGEFLFLIPASYEDWPNLGGEVEIAIGEEWEKHLINTAAVICLPKRAYHCPVYMKSVDKPFYWGHILLAPSYGSSAFDPERPI
ncbi:hypothetical protein ACFLUG_00390 [Chloroflexota bacterium]